MNLGVTNHAVERYIERVKDYLGPAQAKRELIALAKLAKPCERPCWVGPNDAKQWVELAEGVVGAVHGETIATVLVAPPDLHPVERQRRNRRKAAERRAKRTKNGSQSHFNRKGRRPESEAA